MIGDEIAGRVPDRPANFDRWPVAAQRHVESIERIVKAQRDVIEQLSSIDPLGQPGSRIVLDPDKDRQPIGPPYIEPDQRKLSGRYTTIEFNLDDDLDRAHFTVDARVVPQTRGGETHFELQLMSSTGSLIVRPEVTNVINIVVDRRR